MTIEWRYGQHDLFIEFEQYANGGLAVLAWEAGSYEPFAKLSVFMAGEPLPADVFFLKDWSEGKEIATALIHSGLIEAADVPPRLTQGPMPMQVLAYRFKRPPLEPFDEHDARVHDIAMGLDR